MTMQRPVRSREIADDALFVEDARWLGTKLHGGGDIMLGHDDFVRLISDGALGNVAPDREIQTDGVFDRARPDGLSLPVLPLPCQLSALQGFVDSYGLRPAMDPIAMMEVVNRLTWAHVHHESEIASKVSPALGMAALRKKLKVRYDAEGNDSKKVVLREVLDALNELLAPLDSADGDWDSEGACDAATAGKWPWGDYETELLDVLANAVERFWKRYDPNDATTAPTNETVVEWIKEQKVAGRNASFMATILRADGLPTGPRK